MSPLIAVFVYAVASGNWDSPELFRQRPVRAFPQLDAPDAPRGSRPSQRRKQRDSQFTSAESARCISASSLKGKTITMFFLVLQAY